MADRCYMAEGRCGPCCRNRLNNGLYLARIECGLKDAPTREKFIQYLRRRCNLEHIRLTEAYVHLNDPPNGVQIIQEMNYDMPFLLPNSALIERLEDINLDAASETEVVALRQGLIKEIEEQLRNSFHQFAENYNSCPSSRW